MKIGFVHPWVLFALPLVAVLLLRPAATLCPYPWLALLPRDSFSTACAVLLRIASAGALASILVGLAAPYLARRPIEHVGVGAEIVILLDRSLSMDQPFAGSATSNSWSGRSETKATAARRLLTQFATSRAHDRVAIVSFSSTPIQTIPFTSRQELVQAAVGATTLGHGLAETDVGSGLLEALRSFEGRPYTASRIILLVSDGGAEIGFEPGELIRRLMKRERVTLYWLYLRSYRSPGLLSAQEVERSAGDSVPERSLQRFFAGMGTPYSAYETENPVELQRAIADVNRLANLPIRYAEIVPRSDLSGFAYASALVCTLVLLVAKLLETQRWE